MKWFPRTRARLKSFRNPFRSRIQIGHAQLEDMRRATMEHLTIPETLELMKMYQRANECQRGHSEEMANLCKLTIATAYAHTVAIVFWNPPARWLLTVPAGAALAICFTKMIKEHLWMIQDRDKHIGELVAFYLDKLVRDTPQGDELAELLTQAFGSGTVQVETEDMPTDIQQLLKMKSASGMMMMEDFFKKKGGETKEP